MRWGWAWVGLGVAWMLAACAGDDGAPGQEKGTPPGEGQL